MNIKKNRLTLLLLISACSFANAQVDLLAELETEKPTVSKKVFATFKTTRIVNGHSIETLGKRALDFRITHHFGDVAGEGGGIHTLYGFDQASDIRLAFEYGITDKLTVGIGRSKVGETLDGYVKYRFLQQTIDDKMPISVTLVTNAAIISQKQSDKEFDVFAHRVSFMYQALIARKITSKLSLQIAPTLIHRNYLFNVADENDLFSIGLAGRIKLTRSFALLADYFYTFSNFRKNNNQTYFLPLGVGVEIETGGHVFHMFFTNNAPILENSFIANTTSSWTKGEFKFGFTISRVFQGSKSKKG